LPAFASESIRFQETDPQSTPLQRIQRGQNDALRILTGKKRRDHVRISEMLERVNFLSVNQTAAYGLLMELWKARQFDVPVLGTLLARRRNDGRTLRSDSANIVTTSGQEKLLINCERLWNRATTKFKVTNLLKVAKSEAKTIAKSLPI